jgi:hypothetical protein
MFIDLDQTGERFQFFHSTVNPETEEIIYGDPLPDVWVELRPTTAFFEERNKGRARKVEHILNPKTRQMERISYYPELTGEEQAKELEDAYDYAILNFVGFTDKAGNDIPCTRENKIKMMRVPVFSRFVMRCLKVIGASEAEAAKEEEKN